jgi:ribosome-binding factor A
MVTVQEVRVARDFAVARVFFTLMGGALSPAEASDVLNKAAGHLRYLLGRQLRMRTVPELRFEFDASVERGMRLSALIDEAVQSDSAIDPGTSGEVE